MISLSNIWASKQAIDGRDFHCDVTSADKREIRWHSSIYTADIVKKAHIGLSQTGTDILLEIPFRDSLKWICGYELSTIFHYAMRVHSS